MEHKMTFTDAYNIKVRTKNPHARDEYKTMNEIDVGHELTNLVNILTSDIQRNTKSDDKIQAILRSIPTSLLPLVPAWRDDDDLDLLQLSILYNSPKLTEFLVAKKKLFPPWHEPASNPYGHLAALLGRVECLLLLLEHRPGDFFEGNSSKHIIRLPARVNNRLKPFENFKKHGNKRVNFLLNQIKKNALNVETVLKSQDDKEVDLVAALEEDGFASREKNRKPRLSINKMSAGGSFPADAKKGYKPSKEVSKRGTPLPRLTITTVDGAATAGDMTHKQHTFIAEPLKSCTVVAPKSERRYSCLSRKQHAITVFREVPWDVTSAVVRGAGQPVKIKLDTRPNLIRSEKPLLFLDRDKARPIVKKLSVQPTAHLKVLPAKIIPKRSERQRAQSVFVEPKPVATKLLEVGVRGAARYKDFHLKLEHTTPEMTDKVYSLLSKTPLTVAAEFNHSSCVRAILDRVILKCHPHLAVKEPLTLATKIRNLEALQLLINQKINQTDYESAVLTSMREMYPECLAVLLAYRGKERKFLFDGINLYHVLYTQSLMSDYRYEMLPVMTSVLVNNNEDVNARNMRCTYPLYTLINCAFHITIGQQIIYFVQCLNLLLQSKANPHFDESKLPTPNKGSLNIALSREAYSSALVCILENTVSSMNFFENTYWSKLFMKKITTTLITNDRSSRRQLNDILFDYMKKVSSIGLDRFIARCLLRYGANPDFKIMGKYAVNVYFDNILPYLAKFEVEYSTTRWEQELSAITLICRGMTYRCLKEAQLRFLEDHLLQCPIQALPVCRYFAYKIQKLISSPRPLVDLTGHYIWLLMKRNDKRAKMLPVSPDLISFVLPN